MSGKTLRNIALSLVAGLLIAIMAGVIWGFATGAFEPQPDAFETDIVTPP